MGKTQENWVTHQISQNPHLKHHLQLTTKEDVSGSGLGLQTGGRQLTWRWKSKCFVHNVCWDGETMGHRVDSYL